MAYPVMKIIHMMKIIGAALYIDLKLATTTSAQQSQSKCLVAPVTIHVIALLQLLPTCEAISQLLASGDLVRVVGHAYNLHLVHNLEEVGTDLVRRWVDGVDLPHSEGGRTLAEMLRYK